MSWILTMNFGRSECSEEWSLFDCLFSENSLLCLGNILLSYKIGSVVPLQYPVVSKILQLEFNVSSILLLIQISE